MAEPMTMRLTDGRQLAWAEYGDPQGKPLIFLHGTPGSRLQVAPAHDAALEAGVRLIAPDRPGLGKSSSHDGTTFRTFVADLGELIDHLHLDRPVVAGVSGGGGYALQAAATLGARLSGVVLIGAMLPGVPKDALRTQLRQVKLVFSLARVSPRLVERMLAMQVKATAKLDPAKAARLIKSFPPADQRVMSDPVLMQAMSADSLEAVSQGTRAAVAELVAYGREPAIDATGVTVPVTFLQGDQDGNVPLQVAQWAAARIPGAELRVFKGEGHLFLAADPSHLLTLV